MKEGLFTFAKKKLPTLVLGLIISFSSCNGQTSANNSSKQDSTANNFTAHKTEYYSKGKRKYEEDTLTHYRKYYYENGQLAKQGKVISNVWTGLIQTYSETGQLVSEITANEKGKLTDKEFRYYSNQKMMKETYQYFEGNYKDTTNFKFYKIEKSYYSNGQICFEQHSINNKVIETKSWTSNGATKPIEQLSENEMEDLLTKKSPDEESFIALLKANKIDSCLVFFSYVVTNKYGIDGLRNELKKLNKFFKKYPNPKNTVSFGKSSYGVGTFGHDNDGDYEKQSLYQFMKKKGNVKYYFSLYYSDKEPVGVIKYYDSEDLADFKPGKKLKPL